MVTRSCMSKNVHACMTIHIMHFYMHVGLPEYNVWLNLHDIVCNVFLWSAIKTQHVSYECRCLQYCVSESSQGSLIDRLLDVAIFQLILKQQSYLFPNFLYTTRRQYQIIHTQLPTSAPHIPGRTVAVSYTHLTLPTIYSV